MSVGSGHHAREIDCLISRLVNGVCLLGVYARDELPDVTSEIRPSCLILTTDPKHQPGTHWLAFYSPLIGSIDLFDSFRLFYRIYSLDVLDLFYLSYSLQSTSTSVCGHYCIVYIYVCSRKHSLDDIVYLLTKISSRDLFFNEYISNLQIRPCILNPCHRNGQLCKLQCKFC